MLSFPGGTSGKEPTCQCKRCGFEPWVGKIPWMRAWQLTPVFLPGESHGQRSLAGYSSCDRKVSDMTKRLTIRFILCPPYPYPPLGNKLLQVDFPNKDYL